MAIVSANYTPAAGRQVVSLTSWAGDAAFPTTPTAGNQIEGASGLTLSSDGTVTGAAGTYTLRQIIASTGVVEAISYEIVAADTQAPVLSALSATGVDPDTVDVSVTTDEGNGTLYLYASASPTEAAAAVKTGAQGIQAVSTAGVQTLSLVLAEGSYYVHAMHEDGAGNQSAVVSSSQVTLSPLPARATTTVRYVPPAGMALTVLEDPIDTYLLESWPVLPVAGEQVLVNIADGTLSPNFVWTGADGNVEGVFQAWFIADDGVITPFNIDTVGLETAPDNVVVIDSITATKDAATIQFSYAGTTVTGFEYSLDGAPWQAATSPLQLSGLSPETTYTLQIRPTNDGTPGTSTSQAFTTNPAQDVTPGAFSFSPQNNVARGVSIVSNAITVTEVDAGQDVPISVSGDAGSQYSVSTDGGQTYGPWTDQPGTVRLNYRVRVRHTSSSQYSSGGYNGIRSTTLTIGGVVGSFTSITLADTTPPVISLTGGNLNWTQGTPWVEPGYSAIDNADGDISVTGVEIIGTPDVNTLGPQQILYRATDASGNVSESTRTVTIVEATPDDQIAPVITLVGGNRTLTVGDTWVEPGFSATDETDGDLTDLVVVTGTVDTTRPGNNVLTYSVSDLTGNVGTATRTVTVLPVTQYPLDALAPAKRTFEVSRLTEPFANEPLAVVQSGEVLDFDFDLDAWLTDEGDDVAEGSYSVAELSDALEVLAVGQVPGTNRVKVWLGVGDVTESESSLVELTVTSTGYRTGVFHFRALVINRMQ